VVYPHTHVDGNLFAEKRDYSSIPKFASNQPLETDQTNSITTSPPPLSPQHSPQPS
jgi:hypothetical protein